MKGFSFYKTGVNSHWLMMLIVVLISGCSRNPVCGIDGFYNVSTLTMKDSIVLENKGILNPYHVYYKDGFLIFNSIRGEREIQLLNLLTNEVTEYHVIGQGPDEMTNYHTVYTVNEDMYLFADNHRGRVYGVCLDSLRLNSKKDYELLYSLPVAKGGLFLRFMDLPKHVVGIGLLEDGRFGIFDKETDAFEGQMEYPENEIIAPLSYLHKGALYSRTLMASDATGKRMVATAFGLMDFYSFSDDGDLKLMKSNHYHFPLFKTGTNGPAVIFDKEDKAGITGMCADENYVYGLYSDKTIAEFGEGAYDAPYLLVWDWDGNPVKAYELPKALYGFAINGNVIYGLSREETPIVYVLELAEMDR